MADILSEGRWAPSRQVLVAGAAIFTQGTSPPVPCQRHLE